MARLRCRGAAATTARVSHDRPRPPPPRPRLPRARRTPSHRDRWTIAHRRQVLAFLDRAEHAFITQLVDAVVAAPKPREATTRSGAVHRLRYR